MREDGYTLAEMLAALAMVSVAVMGLGLTTRTMTGAQARIQQGDAALSDLAKLRRVAGPMLAASGPFGGEGGESLTGDASQAAFECDAGGCAIALVEQRGGLAARVSSGAGARTLALRGLRKPELRYVSAETGALGDRWPPAEGNGRLAALVLWAGGAPVDVYEIGREQPADCVFDARRNGCAGTGATQ
jgi:prepilin-type N-terminal cleavage/methylation domain-containing protein